MNPVHLLYVIAGAFVLAFSYFALQEMGRSVRRWWHTRYAVWSGSDHEVFDVATLRDYNNVSFFQAAIGHHDDAGNVKTATETNMLCAGMLGAPLTFDPESMELYFDRVEDNADITDFLRCASLTLICGQDRIAVRIPGIMFEPVIHSLKRGGVGATFTELVRVMLTQTVPEITHHFTKPIDVSQISSNENFCVRCELTRPPKLHGPLTLRVALKGILWWPEPGRGPKTKKVKAARPFDRYTDFWLR